MAGPLIALLFLSCLAFPGTDSTKVLVNMIRPMGSAAAEEPSIDFTLLTDVLSRELAFRRMNVADRRRTLNSPRLEALSSTAEFSGESAGLLGTGAGVPLVVLTRIRVLGDRAWVQAGLFDAEAQGLIKETSGYYSRKDLENFGIRDIASKLTEAEKPPQAEKQKAAAPARGLWSRPFKWVVAGAAAATAVFLVREFVITSDQPAAKTSTEITVEW